MFNPSSSSALTPEDKRPPVHGKPISPGESVMEIIGISIVLAIFNAPTVWINMIREFAGPTAFIPVFSAELLSHLPALNLFWGLSMTLAFVRLYYGRRLTTILIGEVVLLLFGMQIAIALLQGGPLLALDGDWMAVQEFSTTLSFTWGSLLDTINLVVKLVIGLALLGSLVTLVQKGIELVRGVQIQIERD